MDAAQEPLDGNYFLSTQIQGRLDELEEEQQLQKHKSSLYLQFSHKSQDTTGPKSTKKPPRIIQRTKKRSEKPSTVQKMMKKLSGKPHKLRKSLVQRHLAVKESLDEAQDIVYTEREWDSLRYRIRTRNNKEQIGAVSMAKEDMPELSQDDWEKLYDRSDHRTYEDRFERDENTYEVKEPITLSQLMRDLRPTFRKEAVDEPVVRLFTPETEVIEISDNDDDDDDDGIDHVSNTSEEGSLILLTEPITIFSNDESSHRPTSSKIAFRGSNVTLRSHVRNMTLNKTTTNEEIINETDDDENDNDYIMEIKLNKST